MRVELLYKLSNGVGLIAAFSLLLAVAPARGDFLDDLFGGDSAPQPAPFRAKPARKAGRDGFSIRTLGNHKPSRMAKDQNADDAGHGPYVAGSRPQKAALCNATGGATKEPALAYLRDETLRAGDSIVTDRAIVVFKGSHACPHTAADFVSVARADLPRAKRNALATLEQSMRSPQRGFALEAGRSKIADRDTP